MTSQTKNKIKATAIMIAAGAVIYAAIEIIKFLGIKGILILGGIWTGRLVWREIYKTLEDRENKDKTNK